MKYVNLTATGEDTAFVLAKAMHLLHGFNAGREANNRIAVAFPAWADAIFDERGKRVQKVRMGAVLRLFATENQLEAFLASAGPQRLCRLGAVEASPVQTVPANCQAVRFVRDRTFERGHPNGAYARRQQRRAQAKGMECHARVTPHQQSFSLALKSKSTGNEFCLDIRKELYEQAYSLQNITAYGLCGEGAAVPVF